jgi:hypothetical protein
MSAPLINVAKQLEGLISQGGKKKEPKVTPHPVQ